jgi:hypothetical protein
MPTPTKAKGVVSAEAYRKLAYEHALLQSNNEQLREALLGLLCLFSAPDEDSLDHWERVAELFRKETGFLRPGKDQAAAAYGPSDEQRQEAWRKWYETKVANAFAAIK